MYCDLWPETCDLWIVDRSTARDYTVSINVFTTTCFGSLRFQSKRWLSGSLLYLVSLYPVFSKLFLRPFSETQQAYVALRAHVWGDPYIWSSNVMGTDLRYTASGFSFKLCLKLFISSTITICLWSGTRIFLLPHESMQKIPSKVGCFGKIAEVMPWRPTLHKKQKISDSFESL